MKEYIWNKHGVCVNFDTPIRVDMGNGYSASVCLAMDNEGKWHNSILYHHGGHYPIKSGHPFADKDDAIQDGYIALAAKLRKEIEWNKSMADLTGYMEAKEQYSYASRQYERLLRALESRRQMTLF